MNRRHVRAVAVFAVVLVTLTGARRSGGGGCDDNDSGSSSSSSSGGFTSGGSTTGGSTPSAPSTYDTNALSEVRVDTCEYDEVARQLKAGLSITNPSATDTFNYSITVKFETSGTSTILGSDFLTSTVTGGQTKTEEATSLYTNTSTGSTSFQCEVSTATKYRSS